MAAIKFIKRTVALDGSGVSEMLPASFFNSESSAHTFIVAGERDGAAVAFTGSVSATFLNANDAVVSLTGSIVDGAAVVTLSNACYALSGRFTLTIDVNGATVYECNSRIKRRSSGTAYDPDDELSVATLSAEIAAMHTATTAANTAAAAANNVDIDLITGTDEATITITRANGTQKSKTLRTLDEQTRNIWIWGDQHPNGRYITITDNVDIPAGNYTLSGVAYNPDGGNARIQFFKSTTLAASTKIAEPYIAADGTRRSINFTLSEKCKMILVLAGVAQSQSGDITWTDIQIEAGNTATDYIPPFSATDYVIREQLREQAILENKTYNGETSVTFDLPEYNNHKETPIICCDAMFTRSSGATDRPRIQMTMLTNRNLTRNTTWYVIGHEDEYQIKEWRAPAYIFENKKVSVNIRVPSGCTLLVRKLWYRYDSSLDRTNGSGIRFFARAGTCNMVPELSLPAMQMSLRHGYDTYVVIPKISSDGVWFAYHDDTFDISTTLLRNQDGTAIASSEYNGRYFHEIPFTYLDQFRYGLYGTLFNGTKIMRLDDCFKFLAKTGMKLRLSIHPYTGINTTQNLTALKKLVEKYGLLKDLTIIVNEISTIFSVFGNDIGGYVFPNSTGANWTGSTNRVDAGYTNAVSAKTNYGITVSINCGLWNDSLFSNLSGAETLVGQILDAGFTAGVFTTNYTGLDGGSHGYLWGRDMEWLMSIGVTEFTDGYNTSVGLNW